MGMNSLYELEKEIDAIIILGSSCSVHDELEWQINFNNWLIPLIDRKVPMLGICYGHQLLAHLEGATIDYVFERDKKRKGLYQVQIEKSDFTDKSAASFVFSHNEAVVSLGEKWKELGFSNELRNEFIKHTEKPLWGIQAHPEASINFGKNSALLKNPCISDLLDGHNFLDSFIYFISH